MGVLLGVTVALSGEYGADGLRFEDEESIMSVSEFRYAVYSGKVWNEWVELDIELFLFDEGKCLCLSILKFFSFYMSVHVSISISFTNSFYSFFIQITIYHYSAQTFFQQDF